MCFQVSSEQFSYAALFSKFRHILNKDGILALWRGHSANVIRVALYAGCHYAIHDSAEYFLTTVEYRYIDWHNARNNIVPGDISDRPSKSRSHWVQFLAGAIGGAGATCITYPLDVFRARLATMAPYQEYSWKAAIQPRGFFHGFVPTLLGDGSKLSGSINTITCNGLQV